MGDRGQIAIQYGDSGRVYLYTHWYGSDIPAILRAALRRGRGRWHDDSYLARIIFCELVRSDPMGETGYGIDLAKHGDTEHPIPVVNCETQTISWEAHFSGAEIPKHCTFADFIEQTDESEDSEED